MLRRGTDANGAVRLQLRVTLGPVVQRPTCVSVRAGAGMHWKGGWGVAPPPPSVRPAYAPALSPQRQCQAQWHL